MDNVHVRPQACESICMCFKVEALLHVGQQQKQQLSFHSCVIYDDQSGYSQKVGIRPSIITAFT